MKIKFKLALIMMCFITIPVLILNVYISSQLTDRAREKYEKTIIKNVKQQSDNIATIFEESLNRAKEVASFAYVKSYTLKANSKSLSLLPKESDYQKVTDIISHLNNFNSDIEKTFIINNSGDIVVCSDAAMFGQKFDTTDLSGIIQQGGGVSSLLLMETRATAFPSYYLARNIYSEENQVQGVLLQLMNTDSIQKILNTTNTYSDSGFAILVDSYGNILEPPYNEVKNFKKSIVYVQVAQYIQNAISVDNKAGQNPFTGFFYNNSSYIVYNTNVSNMHWSVISFANKLDLEADFKDILLTLRVFTSILILLHIIFVFFYVRTFCKPIERMVEVLLKKQRGDKNERLEIKSNDEFGQISEAFNVMFDDIFESEQRYRTIVEMTDNIIFEINFKKNVVFVSNNFNQKFSFRAKSDKLQDSFFYKGRIHKDDKDSFVNDFNKILNEAVYFQGEYRFKNIYGDFAWYLIRGTKFFDREEIPSKIIGVIVDIDREKRSEMHLLQRATYDALTQLYNRETFIKTLAKEFDLSITRKSLDAVLFMDLDDFKHFNDDYGHSCGDEVLKFVSDSLKEIIFEKGFAGRFGGDEFVVCLSNQQYFGDPGKVAQDIIDVLSAGFVSENIDQRLAIHCSIGIAFFYENGKNCDEVLNSADEAMYSVKRHGKSNFAYATPKRACEE